MRQKNVSVEIYGPDYGGAHKKITSIIQKLNISDIVKLDKERMGEDKKKILLSADCFIQTSRTEGLPLGPLEALGYGLPCIVTEGVGLGEMIRSFGAGYCSANSADGVASSIADFIENIDKSERISLAAKQLIAEMFDSDMIAKKTVDRYLNLVHK